MLSVFIERAARLQLMARSAADHGDRSAFAREAHDYRLKPRAVAATFHYFARRFSRGSGRFWSEESGVRVPDALTARSGMVPGLGVL